MLDKIEYFKKYVNLIVVLLPQVNTGYQLLNTIREDLNHVVLVCESQKKPTNYLRNLMSDLVKGKRRFFILTKIIIIFCSTNLISQLITGSRRSYRRLFGQYEIEGAPREQAKRDRMRVLSGRFLHITVLEPDTG